MAPVTGVSRTERWNNWVTQHTEHRLESVTSLSIFVLGIYFVLPFWGGNTFSRNVSSAAAYEFMGRLGPEWAWGSWFIFCAWLARYGIVRKNFRMRQVGMLLVVACRAFMLLSIGSQTGWRGSLLPEHLTWAVSSFWAYWRVKAP